MIFINFKTYEEGSGRNALKLVGVLNEVACQTQVKIIPVVQATDIREVVGSTKLEVWTQTIDPVSHGAHTGAILAEAVFEDGAKGTFLNHSEARFVNFEEIKMAVERANQVGLKTLVFAKDLGELRQVSQLKPTYVAYEPPELIGSTTISVTEARPEIISQSVEIAKSFGIPLIVGAGVHSQNDIKKSLQLGAAGVAVATDIVKAQDPKRELLDLTEGFK
jgi:triosephosphate isomerase